MKMRGFTAILITVGAFFLGATAVPCVAAGNEDRLGQVWREVPLTYPAAVGGQPVVNESFMARANHGMVAHGGRLYLMGGGRLTVAREGRLESSTDARHWVSDPRLSGATTTLRDRDFVNLVVIGDRIFHFDSSHDIRIIDLGDRSRPILRILPSPRLGIYTGHRPIFVFNNLVWSIGRVSGATAVRTSPNGVDWTTLTASAPMGSREEFGTFIFNDRVWIVGGFWQTDLFNDIWSSADGITWIRENDPESPSPFAPRREHRMEVLGDTIFLMGGITAEHPNGSPEIWSSINGTDWVLRSSNAPIDNRRGFGLVEFNGQLVLTGGESSSGRVLDDVWISDDGVNWELVAGTAPPDWEPIFSPRHLHSSVVHQGRLYIAAGNIGRSPSKDSAVWSTADGFDWRKETGEAPFRRREAAGLVSNGQHMFLIGGMSPPVGYVYPELRGIQYDFENMDIWRSSNGKNWTRLTGAGTIPVWGPLFGAGIQWFNDEIIAAGGAEEENLRYSLNIWIHPTGEVRRFNPTNGRLIGSVESPVANRYRHVMLRHDGMLWIIGGVGPTPTRLAKPPVYNDVWSSTDGINWTQVTSDTGFSTRAGMAGTVANGRMYIAGGNDGTHRPSVWSSVDGINWDMELGEGAFSGRQWHTLDYLNGKLILTGGHDGRRRLNDVWISGVGPSLQIDRQEVDFGSVEVTSTWGERSIVVSNPLPDAWHPLRFSRLAVIDDPTGSFTVIPHRISDTIDAGATGQIDIRFIPRAFGEIRATLLIESNDRDNPRVEIPLVGMGIAPENGFSPQTPVYDLGEDDQGWRFVNQTSLFDTVGGEHRASVGGLEMTATTNTNAFASWVSPPFALAANSVHEISANVYTWTPSGDGIPPAYRLRVSPFDMNSVDELTVTSLPQARTLAPGPSGDVQVMRLYTGAETESYTFYFDLLSFGEIASPTAAVGLRSLIVESVEEAVPASPVASFDFREGRTHGFTSGHAAPHLAEPVAMEATGNGLLLRAVGEAAPTQVVFGHWTGDTGISLAADTVYLVRARISTSGDGDTPVVRLRANDTSDQLSILQVLNGDLPEPGATREVSIRVVTPEVLAGEGLRLSLDVLFNPGSNGNGRRGILLEELDVFQMGR